MAHGLTPKQNAFIAAYIGDAHGVGVTAARIAGYAGDYDTLAHAAEDNLKKPHIAAAIDADKARVRCEGIASREERALTRACWCDRSR
jgi:phage terminase small subunit